MHIDSIRVLIILSVSSKPPQALGPPAKIESTFDHNKYSTCRPLNTGALALEATLGYGALEQHLGGFRHWKTHCGRGWRSFGGWPFPAAAGGREGDEGR